MQFQPSAANPADDVLPAYRGLGSVISAVNHLQSGQSMGKVFIQLADEPPSQDPSKL